MFCRSGSFARNGASGAAATGRTAHNPVSLRCIEAPARHCLAKRYAILLQRPSNRTQRLQGGPSAQSTPGVSTAGLADRLQGLGASAQLVLEHPGLRDAPLEQLESGLSALSDWVPRRSLAALLERHPPLLAAPVAAWADFLASFGFQRLAIQELFLNSPDVITGSSVFRAGQVFLFLRQLGLPSGEIVGPIFRWRALLAEGVDFVAAASFLASEGAVAPELMPRLALTYPPLLAAPLDSELRPRLAFLRGLGPEAEGVLRGVLWEDWCGWLHGVANWPTAVAPKLAALEGVMEGRGEAEALLGQVPDALKHPPESRLAPNLRLLMGQVGLRGKSLSRLLRGAPAILSLSPSQLESRWTFLVEAANGSAADLLAHPPYLLAPLDKVTGPRLFYAALRGLTPRLNDPQRRAAGAGGGGGADMGEGAKVGGGRQAASSGSGRSADGDASDDGEGVGLQQHDLDLRWLCEGSDEEWLGRVAAEQRGQRMRKGGGQGQKTGVGSGSVTGGEGEAEEECGAGGVDEGELLLLRGDWEEVVSEWNSLLGWCCDRAFTAAGRKKFEEQLSLFYLLVQG